MAVDFIKKLIKSTKNEDAKLAEDGVFGDVAGYIDTGSYSLNALLSGSIYGGFASNKRLVYAGPPGVGKTYFLLQIAKSFLDKHEENVVVYFDSEGSITKDQLEQFKIDVKRFVVIPVSTIEDFRTQATRVLDSYQDRYGKGGETRMLLGLDSLGNLSSKKEVEDITAGKEARDMTKAQLNRGAFRVLGLKCSILNVPLVVTNHTYDVVGSYVPTKEMSGGSGLKYVSDQVVLLTKSKYRDDDKEVVGAIIKAKLEKSRQTIEQKDVETRLFFDKGLDKYYGLIDIAIKYGIFEKVSTKIVLTDGTSTFEKRILLSPEKYFTEEVLNKIDEACKKEFLYQSNPSEIMNEELDEDTIYNDPFEEIDNNDLNEVNDE